MKKNQKRPIEDPIRYAEMTRSKPFLVRKTVAPWAKWIVRHSTAEFSRLRNGYQRHCGPTAITNLLLSLHQKKPFLRSPIRAEDLFLEVADIGRRRGIYWNTDILHRFGGTYDVLTWKYLHDCLKHYHANAKVAPAVVPSKKRLLKHLDQGAIIYLQLLYNGIYSNHHLLCYGYTVLRDLRQGHTETYLMLADGWSQNVRYLPLSELRIFHYFTIT